MNGCAHALAGVDWTRWIPGPGGATLVPAVGHGAWAKERLDIGHEDIGQGFSGSGG